MRDARSRGGPATVTAKVHELVRLNESVATHCTAVSPIANVVPDAGVQATDTVPWPFRTSGSEKVTDAPDVLGDDTVIAPGQIISGASATGGAGGVGAFGVLHPAPPSSANSNVIQ